MVHLTHHDSKSAPASPTLDHFHRNQWTNSPEYAAKCTDERDSSCFDHGFYPWLLKGPAPKLRQNQKFRSRMPQDRFSGGGRYFSILLFATDGYLVCAAGKARRT